MAVGGAFLTMSAFNAFFFGIRNFAFLKNELSSGGISEVLISSSVNESNRSKFVFERLFHPLQFLELSLVFSPGLGRG